MARVVITRLAKLHRDARGREVPALRGVDLNVESGELLAVVGPSGSGKTTLLRLIAGLDQPTSGAISLDGRAGGTAPRERDVAMVFQTPSLYPHLTLFENIAFGLKLRRVARAEIQTRVRQTADSLGLGQLLERYPAEISGGEAQRAALARAVIRRPGLLLLDEPLSNLDPALRLQLRAEIKRIHEATGATMIHVTHDQGEAMALGTRVAVMRDGRIEQTAPPLELYRHPANRFVAGFIGAPPMNFISGRIIGREGRLRFCVDDGKDSQPGLIELEIPDARAGDVRGRINRAVLLGFRAEDVSATPEMDAPDGLEARVEWIEPLGPETLVHLRAGSIHLVARQPGQSAFAHGQRVRVKIALASAHFFDPGPIQP